jgi:hypothetical protein
MANSLIFINATDDEFRAPRALARGAFGRTRSTIFPNNDFLLRHRWPIHDEKQPVLSNGNFDAATFWQRSPAIAALSALAYGLGAPRVK